MSAAIVKILSAQSGDVATSSEAFADANRALCWARRHASHFDTVLLQNSRGVTTYRSDGRAFRPVEVAS
jgi:hypothetical protein